MSQYSIWMHGPQTAKTLSLQLQFIKMLGKSLLLYSFHNSHELAQHTLDTLLHFLTWQVSGDMDFLDQSPCSYNKIVAILDNFSADP